MQYNYLIIGSGRVAQHFSHYFEQQKIPYLIWSRKHLGDQLQTQLKERATLELKSEVAQFDLNTLIDKATHVLLLISDSAIGAFYEEHLKNKNKICIHFSGALAHEEIHSLHPLMTFSSGLYDLEFYQQIYFVNFSAKKFSQLLPGLNNPHAELDPKNKSYYHALCVMGGNFSHILMQKMLSGFLSMGLPTDAAYLYLQKNMSNVFMAEDSLTGPLVRKDFATIASNLRALKDNSSREIYQGFLQAFFNDQELEQIQGIHKSSLTDNNNEKNNERSRL